VAVFPFRVIGDESGEHAYLGQGLAEELIRVLAAHRGLAVLSGGATAGRTGDAVSIARSLGATAILTGTVRRAAGRVRVSASLVQVPSGVELWGDRFDGRIDDVFAFEETMSMRICEALRVGWICPAGVGPSSPEAIDLYFRARRQMRFHILAGPDGLVDLTQKCLAIAPGFAPALALHALGCAKAWFVPTVARERDWAAAARQAAAHAVEQAPGLAESHLAAAMVAAQDGNYVAAVRSLGRALDLAPTTADAHLYLGRLQAEAGRGRDAVRHLELALALDPSLLDPGFDLARYHALRGDRSHTAALWLREGYARMWALTLLLRIAGWYRDEVEIRRCLGELGELTTHTGEASVLVRFARYILGDGDGATIDREFIELVPLPALSARVRSNLHQLMAEGHAARGDTPRALAHLAAAADEALIDLDWLTLCPLLASLRDEPGFRAVHDRVRTRAEAIWRA
jgi:serine/threonine-protein kinase